MFRSHSRALPSRLVLASALVGMALAGCNQSASNTASAANVAAAPAGALPLVTAEVALTPAPPASQLPPAPPPQIGRVESGADAYAFAERAAEMSQAFADAPPDYTYDDQGVRPWIWRTRDGYERVAEAIPSGERYYYYQPGSDEPFYIQDPDYGYGFDGGVLVVIYDHAGHQLPPDAARADWAGRYLLRARALYDGAQQQPHEGVSANNWRSRRDEIAAQNSTWAAEQQADPDWRAYHDVHEAQEQAHWQAERLQRMTWAAVADQMINDPARAQRDLQAAQSDAQSTGQAPPPALAGLAARSPTSPYAAPSAGAQSRANLASQQAAAQANAAADHAAAAREAAVRAQLAQQQAAAAQSQANLAHQRADAAQAAQQARAAAQTQAQAARRAQQQAAAAHADAELAQRQQAAAAQAQAQAAQKARAAQQQAREASAHVAASTAQGRRQPEGTPAEHKPAHHPASNAAQDKGSQ
ncbi:MAG TPA: hypothetical protein VMU37_02435 [Caulobacteraceae bacterium]|nr:hypothetical protein [Caulobacteraceae bacterium]